MLAILTLVLPSDGEAVLCAAELAFEAGVPTGARPRSDQRTMNSDDMRHIARALIFLVRGKVTG